MNPKDIRTAAAAIRRAWHLKSKTRRPIFVRLSDDPELVHAALDIGVGGIMAQGALTPDHLVYAGAYSIFAHDIGEIGPALRSSAAEPAAPQVVLVNRFGTFVIADSAEKLKVIERVASAAAKTIRLASGRDGVFNLSEEAAQFIIDWESEHYRMAVLEKPRAPLAGKVAFVTGAASGLGLGIAHGLFNAGAAVAFCDIDEKGLLEAVSPICPPDRALKVAADVTKEESIAAAFDTVVKHWGGIDILVCAAGIAPASPLVEMPLDKWQKALDINLTGYFLAGREAVRVMHAQRHGGAVVLISSKSGLEASVANSAYNATKAGELHLMRGWAKELGKDGIRVNAVAPGNVFEGSKIWNEEYIKAIAKKRGIKPEEVIPYYVSLTALKREIRRSDVAAAVCFLCSDDARCITGQTLVVDGGQVAVR